MSTFLVEFYAGHEDLYPRKHLPSDAGFDIRSSERVEFQSGERKFVGTGLALRPEARTGHLTWDIQVRARGSMWKRGFNTHFGTGDFLFHSEYKVGLEWTGKEPITIERGERIAQLVFYVSKDEFMMCAADEPFPENRGGFGSSGRQ